MGRRCSKWRPILSLLIISIPPTAAGNHRRHSAISRPGAISDYWALTKPEVNFLIVIVTFTGFYLAFSGPLVRFFLYFSFG
jgi:heme O synthase-like polyprenyltransferase